MDKPVTKEAVEPWAGLPEAAGCSGWHWLSLHGAEPVPTQWRAEDARWVNPPSWGGWFRAAHLVGEGFAYHGPCLSPTERDAALAAAQSARCQGIREAATLVGSLAHRHREWSIPARNARAMAAAILALATPVATADSTKDQEA